MGSYMVFMVRFLYWGYSSFLVEYFKSTFFHGFPAKNEWRDIVKGCDGRSNLEIWRSALVVIFKNTKQLPNVQEMLQGNYYVHICSTNIVQNKRL